MKKKYPFTKQTGLKDCAAASLQMIIKYYQGYVSLDELNYLLNTNKNGTTAYDIITVATKLGFKANGIKITMDELTSDNIVLPCIVHTIIDDKYKHFMVIYEINSKKKYLVIADPQNKIKKISYDEFSKIYNNIVLNLYPIKPIVHNNEVSLKMIFINVISNYKKEIIHLLYISLIFMILSLLTSFYIKIIFDNINLSKQYLTVIFSFFLILNFLKITSNFLRTKLLIFINQKIDVEINMDAYRKVINLPYHYYKNRTTGEMVSKLIDLDRVREMINKVIIILFVDLPLTLITTIVLIIISKKLFIISLLFLFMYFLIVTISKKYISDQTEECYKDKAETVSFMEESINGFETVKGLNIEDKVIKKYEKKYVRYLKQVIKLDNILNIQAYLKEFINITSELLILFVGSILVKNNVITIGTLLAFNSIQVFFFTPIRNIIDLDVSLIEAKKVLKKVYEMFNENEFNAKSIAEIKGSIEISNLSYNYQYKRVLKNISLKINKGEKVIILGDSGSGKSTLLKILIGYLNIRRNMVKFDGVDIKDISNIRDSITYVSQNEVLFTDTLYNNINICNDSDIKNIAQKCYIDEFVSDDALGYNMVLEENGFNISGGQKQRIVLARALLKKINVLLIDEGLNQMDINLERKILKNIFSSYSDKTIIIVSHRRENIDLFDHLIEMADGKVVKDVVRNA